MSNKENESACESIEFAEILFQKFVSDRELRFLESSVEGLPESNLGVFKMRKFVLLVACGMLSFGFNGSGQSKVGISVSHFKKIAQSHAQSVWPDENFESNLALGVMTCDDCIRQMRENGRPSLAWVSETLQGMGITVTNPATLLLVAFEMTEHFMGLVECMKAVTLA